VIQIPNKPYKFLGPNELFEGRSYGDLQEEFWKWLFSIDCDRYNIGDVVFLRGVPFPENLEKSGDKYMSAPVIMVDENKLVISEDQAIFFCCYTTLSESESMGQMIPDTEHARRNDVVLALNRAGIPDKKQISIDGEEIITPDDLPLDRFRVVTNEFILNVPDPTSGKTLGPYFETELSSGEHPSVAGGYCILLQFTEGTHYIHSIGKGVEWQGGDYVTELFYEIKVIKSNRSKVPLGMLKSFAEGRVKNRIAKLEREKMLTLPGAKVSPSPLLSKLVDQNNWEN